MKLMLRKKQGKCLFLSNSWIHVCFFQNTTRQSVVPSAVFWKMMTQPTTNSSYFTDVQVPVKDVQTTSNALPVQRNVAGASDSDTLADKYMKEWKPTGRFQCK